jgi:hypothetical protein
MIDSTFRSAPAPAVETPASTLPEPEINNQGVMQQADDSEPIELRDTGGRSVVLDALNIDENTNNLPDDDKTKVNDVKEYVMGILKSKGLSPTVNSFKKALDEVKGEMGLDKEADPAIVLDRVAGVVRAWRNLTFIKDLSEKKRIFMKLANLKSSEDMNREVYKLMNDYEVWR